MMLSGRKILVTGGTGFIGTRLVEKLVGEDHAKVRVLVHRAGNAMRVARLPVELLGGDVLDPVQVRRAVEDCEVVFHCALGSGVDDARQWQVNVEGTRIVLQAALNARVRRFVHFSTVTVYGLTADGDLDETAPRRRMGKTYADSKLEAEKVALEFCRTQGLPVAILQPTAVFGPFARLWTIHVIEKLKSGRVMLINDGYGLRNLVYIDDVVQAARLAATEDSATGEAFLIAGESPVTWRQFYQHFEQMLGLCNRTVGIGAAEAEALYFRAQKGRSLVKELSLLAYQEPELYRRLCQTRELALLFKIARRLLPEPWQYRLKQAAASHPQSDAARRSVSAPGKIHLMDPTAIRFAAAKTRVRIDKAKRVLGYRPKYDFAAGMQLTEQWARWANLLGEAERQCA